MAIAAGVCNNFKEGVLKGQFDLLNDVFKIALYTSVASIGPTTTVYSATNESSGTGYTAGGMTLTGANVSLVSGVAIATFNDVTWLTATISAAGALIYDSTKANAAVVVLDFSGTKSSTAGDFKVIMPTFDALNALIQLA